MRCNPQRSVTEELRSGAWGQNNAQYIVLPTVGGRQKVHSETELKIAPYLPWQATIYCNSNFYSLTHTHTHYANCQFHTEHSAPALSENGLQNKYKEKTGDVLMSRQIQRPPRPGTSKAIWMGVWRETQALGFIHASLLPWLIIEQADTLRHFLWLSVNYWCMAQYNGPIWSGPHLRWSQD